MYITLADQESLNSPSGPRLSFSLSPSAFPLFKLACHIFILYLHILYKYISYTYTIMWTSIYEYFIHYLLLSVVGTSTLSLSLPADFLLSFSPQLNCAFLSFYPALLSVFFFCSSIYLSLLVSLSLLYRT